MLVNQEWSVVKLPHRAPMSGNIANKPLAPRISMSYLISFLKLNKRSMITPKIIPIAKCAIARGTQITTKTNKKAILNKSEG